MKIKVTEEIWKEGNMYVSYCPELDMASCGESIEESKKNLKEVISINFAECRKMGTLNQLLQDTGFTEDQDNVLLARKELVSFSPLEVGICCDSQISGSPGLYHQKQHEGHRDDKRSILSVSGKHLNSTPAKC